MAQEVIRPAIACTIECEILFPINKRLLVKGLIKPVNSSSGAEIVAKMAVLGGLVSD
jgi:hypothetical protein